ncbi:MAG: hypothetical protein V2A73_06430, partial [Pseudomonadota bacterium]
ADRFHRGIVCSPRKRSTFAKISPPDSIFSRCSCQSGTSAAAGVPVRLESSPKLLKQVGKALVHLLRTRNGELFTPVTLAKGYHFAVQGDPQSYSVIRLVGAS